MAGLGDHNKVITGTKAARDDLTNATGKPDFPWLITEFGVSTTGRACRRLFSLGCVFTPAWLCFRTYTAGTTTSSWRIVKSATVEMTRAPPRDFCLCRYGF